MALCKVCGTTNGDLFYPSHSTYCKEHWKERVRQNRLEKVEYYRSFEKMRASMPHRVKARKDYAKTEAYRISHKIANAKWVAKNPERRIASHIVGNAVRDGRLRKSPCFVCGSENVEAHHPDYSEPLSVVWLCIEHHKEIHWHMKEAA